MNDGIQIRPFAPGDRELVNAFFDRMGPETRFFFNQGDGNRRTALRYFDGQDPTPTLRWLAEAEGRMVGYVFLWDLHTAIPWLGIAVADDLKGQGLGTRLIETAKDYCRDQGKGGILLTTHYANTRGQALYGGRGFERLGLFDASEMLYLYRFKQQP